MNLNILKMLTEKDRKKAIGDMVKEYIGLKPMITRAEALRKSLSDALQEFGFLQPGKRWFFLVTDRSTNYMLAGDQRDKIEVLPDLLVRLVGYEKALSLMVPPKFTHLQEMAKNGELYTAGPNPPRRIKPEEINEVVSRKPHPDLHLTHSVQSRAIPTELAQRSAENALPVKEVSVDDAPDSDEGDEPSEG